MSTITQDEAEVTAEQALDAIERVAESPLTSGANRGLLTKALELLRRGHGGEVAAAPASSRRKR